MPGSVSEVVLDIVMVQRNLKSTSRKDVDALGLKNEDKLAS